MLTALTTLAGCARSHGLAAEEDAGSPDAGLPVVDAGGLPDASPADGAPDGLDATLEPDAALPDASVDAEPSSAFLVYTTRNPDSGLTTSYAMRGDDFSVRRLDPAAPAERPASATPLAYSPDGSWLLLQERHDGVTMLWLAKPCRTDDCPAAAERLLLSSHEDPDGRLAVPNLQVEFSTDGRGLLFESPEGGGYVPLDDDGPGPAIALAGELGSVQLLGGSRAALGVDTDGVRFLDLHPGGGAPLERVSLALPSHSGAEVAAATVSPDGAHWVVSTFSRLWVFALEAVRAGTLQGRELPGQRSQLHVADGFMAVRREAEVTLYAWDALDTPLPVGDAVDEMVACGNHLALLEDETLSLFDLSPRTDGAAPPALTLTGMPSVGAHFVGDCAKLRLSAEGNPAPALLVDPDDGSTRDVTGEGWFGNADASLLWSRADGLEEVVRTDTLGQAEPVRYTPRTPLPATDPFFPPGTRTLLAAGPLRELLEWRVFEVDFDGPDAPRVEPLTPEGVEVNGGFTLSTDGRYLAYGVGYPELPADLEALQAGVFERDLQTGAVQRVSEPFTRRKGGTRQVLPIPGQPAVVLVGDYAGQPRTSLQVANLETEALISQLPEPTRTLVMPSWPPFDDAYALDQLVSPDGKLLWYRAVIDGAVRCAQPLRLGASTPLREAAVLRFDEPEPAYPQQAFDFTLGFVQGVGPVYYRPTGELSPQHALYYFDVSSGEEQPVQSAGVDPTEGLEFLALGEATGKLALRPYDGSVVETLLLAQLGEPEATVEVHRARWLDGVAFSPDERWLTFLAGGAAQVARHFYDTQTGESRVVTDISSSPHEARFHPDGTRVLFAAGDESPRLLDLGTPDAEPEPLDGMPLDAQLSADWGWAAWSTPGGVVVQRRSAPPARWTLGSGAASEVRLSASGASLLVQWASDGPWNHYRTADLEAQGDSAEGAMLAESAQAVPFFGPDEKLVLGRWYSGRGLAVWSLADPGSLQHRIDRDIVELSLWIEGAPER